MTPVSPTPPGGLLAVPAQDVGEVVVGDDLVEVLAGAWTGAGTAPQDGDVLVVTSKVVSKAEGRVVAAEPGAALDKDAVVDAETVRDVARRGPTRIVRTRHGFVMAAAGVDASNVAAGSLVMLPLDPDASARRIRDGFQSRGVCVGVVVSDTSGRAWRTGQTDVALGAAGLVVLDDHGGRVDAYGNALLVTAPAVADEIASTAELATGKLSGAPACLVRGLARFVLPAGSHGDGAAALVRPEATDMFGLGAREAVVEAVAAAAGTVPPGFGVPATPAEVLAALGSALPHLEVRADDEGGIVVHLPAEPFEAGRQAARAGALLTAHGWRARPTRHRTMVAVADL
jgi:coenzyme F420-0:L-glutamate ligase/coenzyme F420-1:gamma-L-glutamate ligase